MQDKTLNFEDVCVSLVFKLNISHTLDLHGMVSLSVRRRIPILVWGTGFEWNCFQVILSKSRARAFKLK